MPQHFIEGYLIDEIRFHNNETNEEVPYVPNFVMLQVNDATRVKQMTDKSKVVMATFRLWIFR